MLRRARTLAAVVVLVAGLGACSGDDDDGGTTSTTAGPSSTTSTTEASADETTTTAAVAAEIVLRGDGLGVVDLGATPDAAIAAVTAALGEPTRDTGWEPSFSEYGTCPGEQIRGVEWDHLVLVFTDGDTAYGSGQHLFTWRITGAPPALGTAVGLGYQATVADAEELYPGAVEHIEADDPFPGFLTIAADGGPITAYLDGDVITNLEAGSPCGE
jgi:hypothetical protein